MLKIRYYPNCSICNIFDVKHSTVRINFLRYLANQGLRIFTIGQAQETAHQEGINPGYVAEALHHLLKGKWVVRLK